MTTSSPNATSMTAAATRRSKRRGARSGSSHERRASRHAALAAHDGGLVGRCAVRCGALYGSRGSRSSSSLVGSFCSIAIFDGEVEKRFAIFDGEVEKRFAIRRRRSCKTVRHPSTAKLQNGSPSVDGEVEKRFAILRRRSCKTVRLRRRVCKAVRDPSSMWVSSSASRRCGVSSSASPRHRCRVARGLPRAAWTSDLPRGTSPTARRGGRVGTTKSRHAVDRAFRAGCAACRPLRG